MWQAIQRAVKQKGPKRYKVSKIKGHFTDEMMKEGEYSRGQKICNDAADAAAKALREPAANLALLGTGGTSQRKTLCGASLFVFSLAQAAHCRRFFGFETRLLCECPSVAAFDVVSDAVHADESGVACAALLPPNAALWFHASASRVNEEMMALQQAA